MAMTSACDIRVRGAVQGVGFRPFVYRLAHANTLAGWVLNDGDGVAIHLEGADRSLEEFVRALRTEPPSAASIVAIDIRPALPAGCEDFSIRQSQNGKRPSARILPLLMWPTEDGRLSKIT